MEIGSTQTVVSASDLLADKSDEVSYKCDHVLPSDHLKKLVENSPNSSTCYGIEWACSENGHLVYKSHYNLQWMMDAVRSQGLQGLYTTRSSEYTFMPGQ